MLDHKAATHSQMFVPASGLLMMDHKGSTYGTSYNDAKERSYAPDMKI